MDFDKDYYGVLGVSQNAEDFLIKAAYKALAQRYHPDKDNSNYSGDKMKAINEAYSILSDVHKRKQYDDYLKYKNSNKPNQNHSQPEEQNTNDINQRNEELAAVITTLILSAVLTIVSVFVVFFVSVISFARNLYQKFLDSCDENAKRAQYEAELKRKQDEEELKRKQHEENLKSKQREDELKRRQHEELKRKQREEELKRKQREENLKRYEENLKTKQREDELKKQHVNSKSGSHSWVMWLLIFAIPVFGFLLIPSTAKYNSSGNEYYNHKEWDKAIAMYQEALKRNKELGRQLDVAITYANLGNAYGGSGNFEEAKRNYQLAIDLYNSLNNIDDAKKVQSWSDALTPVIAESEVAIPFPIKYNNSGNEYYRRKEWGKAISMYQEALKLNEKLGNQSDMAINYGNLGNAYAGAGNIEEAKRNYQQAINLYSSSGKFSDAKKVKKWSDALRVIDKYSSAAEKIKLATFYAKSGNEYYKHKEWGKAIDMYQKALPIYDSLGNKEAKVKIYKSLSEAYQKHGNLDKAIEMLQFVITK